MATDSNGAWWDQYKGLSSSLPVQSWSAPTGADSGAGSAPVSRGQSLRNFGKDALGVNLSWTDLEWCVKQPGGGKKQVLFGLNGLVRSGEMLAVLGPSGSGKSTLLDILAMRKTSGNTRGFVRVNGLERKEGHFNRASAYVPQDDVFLPTLTVEETLIYYAELVIARAPRSVKLARITEVLRIVGLERSRRTKVGGSLPGGLTVRGCSGGERKRLNLATAMLARPSLIFIDEPTSGLDAFASLRVLETIRGLSHGAAGGPRPAVVVTVHQPRSAAWQIFEEIYLMSEGHLIYTGPAEKAAEWFDSLGFGMCHTAANPADWLVDLVTLGFDKGNRNKADEENTIRSLPQLRQAATHFAASPRMAALKSLVGDMVPIEVAEDELWPPVKRQHSNSPGSTHASFLAQFQTLLWRHSLSYRRNVGNVAARVGLSLSCGLLVGISYYGLGDEVKNIPDRLGVLFFICMTYLITPCASMSLFVADRRFYAAEAAAQLYGALPYYMAVAVCETVVNLVCAVIFWSIVHPMANFRQGWQFYFQGAAISGLLQLCGAQITNLAALVTPNQELAFVTAIAYQVTNYVSAGYLVRTPDLPVVARWFRFLSPCKYGFQALASNEYAGKVMDREARLRAMKDAMGPEGLGSGLLYWARMVPGGESIVDNTLGTAFMSMDTCLTGMFHSGTEALACVHLTEPSAEAVMYNASFMIPQLLVGHILGLFALKVLYPERR